MRGNGHKAVPLQEPVNHGLGQSSPLAGIGAHAEFVQYDQGVRTDMRPQSCKMADLGRECTQTVLEALLVSHGDKNPIDIRQPAIRGYGNRQGSSGHEGDQPQRLEADGLAAGIAATDNEPLLPGFQHDIHGYHSTSLQREQGMTGTHEMQGGAGLHGQDDPFDGGCEPDLGLEDIHHDQPVVHIPDVCQILTHEIREQREDLALLFTLLLLEIPDLVVQLNEKKRLDITGLPGMGKIMDDPLDLALEIGLDRENVPVRGDGQELVLQKMENILVPEKIVHLAGTPGQNGAHLLPHGVQAGGAFVLELPVTAHAPSEPGPGFGGPCNLFGHVHEQGKTVLVRTENGVPTGLGGLEHP